MKFELRDWVYDFRNGITYGFTLVSEPNPEYKNNPERDLWYRFCKYRRRS